MEQDKASKQIVQLAEETNVLREKYHKAVQQQIKDQKIIVDQHDSLKSLKEKILELEKEMSKELEGKTSPVKPPSSK